MKMRIHLLIALALLPATTRALYADGPATAEVAAVPNADQIFYEIIFAVNNNLGDTRVQARYFAQLATPAQQVAFINFAPPAMPATPLALHAFATYLLENGGAVEIAAQAFRAAVWSEVMPLVQRAQTGATFSTRSQRTYPVLARELVILASELDSRGTLVPTHGQGQEALPALRAFVYQCVQEADNFLLDHNREIARASLTTRAVSPQLFSLMPAQTAHQRLRQLLYLQFFILYDQGMPRDSMQERPKLLPIVQGEQPQIKPAERVNRLMVEMAEFLHLPENGDLLKAFSEALIASGRYELATVRQALLTGSQASQDPQVRHRGRIWADYLSFVEASMRRLAGQHGIGSGESLYERGLRFRQVVDTLHVAAFHQGHLKPARAAALLADVKTWSSGAALPEPMLRAWEVLAGESAAADFALAQAERLDSDRAFNRTPQREIGRQVDAKLEALRLSWGVQPERASLWVAEGLVDPHAFENSAGRLRRFSAEHFATALDSLSRTVLRRTTRPAK